MSRIGECNGCKVGDHKRHHRVVQAVPKGMMGGVICPCKGECRDKTPEQIARDLGIPDFHWFGAAKETT